MPIDKDDLIEERGGAILDSYYDTIAVMMMFSDFLKRRMKSYPESPERDAVLTRITGFKNRQLEALETAQSMAQMFMNFVGSHPPPP